MMKYVYSDILISHSRTTALQATSKKEISVPFFIARAAREYGYGGSNMAIMTNSESQEISCNAASRNDKYDHAPKFMRA